MNPALLAVILQDLPALIQLVQNMIANFNSDNSSITQEQITQMQSQVTKLVNMANEALTQQMNAVTNTGTSITTVASGN